MRIRVALGALGVVVGLYGAWLVLSRGHDLLNLVLWLAGGVVLHDGVLAVVVLVVGAVAMRLLPRSAKAPAVVGFVVLGSVTLLAVPVLGRFGARSDNPTLLDRNYTVGWLVLAGLVLVVVVAASLVRLETEVTVARVLVVDDDPTVREVVVSYLRAADHEVVEAGDGETALERHRDAPHDLVVLDLMLPGIDGIEVCRRLREHGDVPVIMLTALGEETDRVMGLEVGADDYVTKPFSPRELALRVDSVLRRVDAPTAPRRLVDGDLVVDEARHAAYRGGEPLALTGREFDLLRFLLAHPGTAYSRDELLEQVWGWSFGDQSTVTVHVRRLREKIEPDPTRPVRLADGVGRRLPMGGCAREQRPAPDPAGGQLRARSGWASSAWPWRGRSGTRLDLLAARARRGGGHRLGAGRGRRDRPADVHLGARPRGGDLS